MAYDDSPFRATGTESRGTAFSTVAPEPRYLGEGFRQEPDFRAGLAAYSSTPVDPSTLPDSENESTLTLTRRVPPTPNLDYVFDDPADGEPGRDRMLVHLLWEVFLALLAGGAGYLLYREDPTAFDGDKLRDLLLTASVFGALAVGSGLALRAGAPNLAVGPAFLAAVVYFHNHSGGGLIKPIGVVIGAGLVIGVLIGIAVVGLHVPAWAASLGAGLGIAVWLDYQGASQPTGTGYDPTDHAVYWFAGVCALSVFGGLLGLVPTIRRAVGRFRPVSDPADRRGPVAATITLCALAGSVVFAGLAGFLGGARGAVSLAGQDGLVLSGLAIGLALLGGTSAFGRRGGVFGTIFAVALLTIVQQYDEVTDRRWPLVLYAAVAIGIGLVATRLIEHFGRPRRDEETAEEEEWSPPTPEPAVGDWPTARQGGSWPAGPPASGGLWGSDDSWSSPR
jgi:ribose/xylose/arabinose/galactoside ABC-type transport system permease subunit